MKEQRLIKVVNEWGLSKLKDEVEFINPDTGEKLSISELFKQGWSLVHNFQMSGGFVSASIAMAVEGGQKFCTPKTESKEVRVKSPFVTLLLLEREKPDKEKETEVDN